LIRKGIYEPKEIEISDTFSTFDSALNEFLTHTNIINSAEYFHHFDKQISSFEGQIQ